MYKDLVIYHVVRSLLRCIQGRVLFRFFLFPRACFGVLRPLKFYFRACSRMYMHVCFFVFRIIVCVHLVRSSLIHSGFSDYYIAIIETRTCSLNQHFAGDDLNNASRPINIQFPGHTHRLSSHPMALPSLWNLSRNFVSVESHPSRMF